MNHSAIVLVFATLVGCRQDKAIEEHALQMPDDTKIRLIYECPEGYPRILSRLVYARFKDEDPFVIDPDRPPKGLLIENWPLDSIRDLGFTFMSGDYLSYDPSSQTLLVVAAPKTHEKFVKFHENQGIKIVNPSEQAVRGNRR